MAKKDKNKGNKVSTDESTGSKIVTVLIVLVIVVIWLAIFGVLIKLDVGNFGSAISGFERCSSCEYDFAGTGTESE